MKITLDLSQIIQEHSKLSTQEGIYKYLLSLIIPPLIKFLLEYTQGNKTEAARLSGLSRSTFERKIRHYNIVLEKHVRLAKEDV